MTNTCPARGDAAIDTTQTPLGRAALLRSESPESYRALAEQCAAAITPRDMIEEVMLRDYVDLTWEIVRLRRMQPHVVAIASPDAERYVAAELAAAEVRGANGEAASRPAGRGEVTEDTIEAHAFVRELDAIDALERLVADKEAMRRAVLRDLEAWRAGAAWRAMPGEEARATEAR